MEEAKLFAVDPLDPPTVVGLNAATRGVIGETRAIAKLLELGHKVAVPVVDDDGVDLVVDYRLRLQVKTCAVQSKPRRKASRGASYMFGLVSGRNSHLLWDASRSDFLCCHAISDDIWWVIPSRVIPASTKLLTISHGSQLAAYQDGWDQLVT